MKKQNQKCELLSPAGSMDSFYQALHNGADAVYVGAKSFSARAFADNFTYDEIKQCCDYAHVFGKKIYLTANTLIFQNEINDFLNHIEKACNAGIDAVIIQDIGIASIIKQNFKGLSLHASTQMHNHNVGSLKYLKQQGFNRTVFARECDIDEISKQVDIEKEVFIHGALCISYSGQCLISALTKQRSGNRGQCAQSCRMKYSLMSENNDDSDMQTHIKDKYLLSPKDLSLLTDIKPLLDAQINSLKIEGRMKSPQYVGLVTKIYRSILDNYYSNKPLDVDSVDLENLKKLFNRGYSKGYISGGFGESLMNKTRPNHKGIPIGKTTNISRQKITIKLTDSIHQHDGIKFDNVDKGFICEKIYDKNGLYINSAKKNQTITLDNTIGLKNADTLLKTKDYLLEKELKKLPTLKREIDIKIIAKIGIPIKAIFSSCDKYISAYSENPQAAKNKPTSIKDIEQQMLKLGDTPFVCKKIDIECDENIFIPRSLLNELRRNASSKLYEKLTHQKNIKRVEFTKNTKSQNLLKKQPIGFTVFVTNQEQLDAALEFDIKRIYTDDFSLYLNNKENLTNFYYSVNRINNSSYNFESEKLLLGDTSSLYKYNEKNKIVCDYTLNATNIHTLYQLNKMKAQSICLSQELSKEQIKGIINEYTKTFGEKPNIELFVYGKPSVMLIKNCIIASALSNKKHCGLCKTKNYYLNDIHQNQYAIKTDTQNCTNTIYAHKDIQILDIEYYKSIGVQNFRIAFLSQGYNQCMQILKSYFYSMPI